MLRTVTNLFLLLLFTFTLNAQHTLEVGWGYTWGPDAPKSAFALSWVGSEGALSGGVVRLNYTNSRNQDNDNGFYFYYIEEGALRRDILQLDLAKRWYSSKKKRVTVYMETGLSGMVMDNPVGYSFNGSYYPCCEFCDCIFAPITVPTYSNGSNEEANYSYQRKDRQYEIAFLPGASIGAGLDVNLNKWLYIGAHTRLNSYYELGQRELISFLLGGVNVGFRL